MPPVSGYQAAPLVVPFSNCGAPTLHGSPVNILPWLNEYDPARCLNTSSSGVNEGVDNTELKMELGVLSNG